nr:LuxR C-terminal-related transcriptional regulator [uncultured Gellertiella sp.]
MINTGRQSLLTGELAAAKSREALKIALGNVRESFGFHHVSLMRVPGEQDKLLSPLLIESTLQAAFLREFDKNQLLSICPVGLKLKTSLLPQAWRVEDYRTAETKARLVDFIALLTRHDMAGGVMFPHFLSDGNRYALRFDGNRNALCQSETNELAMLSLHALDIYNRIGLTRESQHVPLSARELEVVSWTAQGKTSVEIGQILTLSDHTVNAYLTNAIRKLDCVNRTQLVAKALRLKLIS